MKEFSLEIAELFLGASSQCTNHGEGCPEARTTKPLCTFDRCNALWHTRGIRYLLYFLVLPATIDGCSCCCCVTNSKSLHSRKAIMFKIKWWRRKNKSQQHLMSESFLFLIEFSSELPFVYQREAQGCCCFLLHVSCPSPQTASWIVHV